MDVDPDRWGERPSDPRTRRKAEELKAVTCLSGERTHYAFAPNYNWTLCGKWADNTASGRVTCRVCLVAAITARREAENPHE